MISTAAISACGKYRYDLVREWDSTKPRLVVCMLNPSTADAERDDPTILALIWFSTLWGYGGLQVINLNAWRASKPRDLLIAQRARVDIVGGFNPQFWELARKYALEHKVPILVAWGNNASLHDTRRFHEFMGPEIPLICLGHTAHGAPIHPAARGKHRIPRDLQPIPYQPKAAA
ncbi:DUF1643 domain-containing protein [Novosphingobium sp. FSW06-99]|uniref:DUF1643 domain-containing protein n=1 Tax=Novosphingobium sp. FSW06-99 TaxID=1739113 RepID=UPI00076CFBDA|nr:DUF1643 domain-containing protein [Novosphingobium sp. FSW06-99]KUR80800.1 hypothetical protein AQZ49_01865 [Novosphingobium sp. FSW06-99]